MLFYFMLENWQSNIVECFVRFTFCRQTTLTFQRMSKEANKVVGATAARLARAEGMEAHARTGDIRLKKYGHSA